MKGNTMNASLIFALVIQTAIVLAMICGAVWGVSDMLCDMIASRRAEAIRARRKAESDALWDVYCKYGRAARSTSDSDKRATLFALSEPARRAALRHDNRTNKAIRKIAPRAAAY